MKRLVLEDFSEKQEKGVLILHQGRFTLVQKISWEDDIKTEIINLLQKTNNSSINFRVRKKEIFVTLDQLKKNLVTGLTFEQIKNNI